MRSPWTTLLSVFAVLLLLSTACNTERLAPVDEEPVLSITVNPPELSLAVGSRVAVLALVLGTNGNTLSRSVAWSSSNAAIAAVTQTGGASGEVRGVTVGTASLTATSGTKSTSVAVTVTQQPIVAVDTVVLAPSSASVDVGQTVQLTAVAKDAIGNVLTGRAISWSSSNTSIATVASAGLVTGVAPGSAGITASSEGQQTTATITVMTPPATPVASVDVTPATLTVGAGQTAQLTATPKSAAGTPLTGRTITWTSSNVAVATVSSTGLVNGVSAGSATITATSEGKSGQSAVTVSAAPPVPVATVTVTPATASVVIGQTVQLAATPKDANGNTLSGRVVTWSSSNAAVATVSATGLVTGVSAGTATITAMSEGKAGTASITVTAPPPPPPPAVASVSVTPATGSVVAGQSVQLTATPRDASGNALTGRVVTWTSSNAAVATVSSTGLVTGASAGAVTITATSEGRSGTASITVTATVTSPGTVTNLSVASVTANSVTLSFTEVTNGAGSPASYEVRYAVSPISWGSATPVAQGTCAVPLAGTAIGTTRNCTVQGLAASTSYQFQLVPFRGTLNVDAVFGGLSNVASGTTSASTAPVATVTVSPATSTVAVGATQQFTATLKDASGNTLTGRAVSWSSSSISIASVSPGGLVTGVALGTASITATSEGKSATASVTVSASPPPGNWPNEPAGLTVLTDYAGNTLPAGGGWGVYDPAGQTISIVSDPTAPFSPSNVYQHLYPAGLNAGDSGPLSWFFLTRNEVYIGVYFKYSSPWQQPGAQLSKLFYVYQMLGGDRQATFMTLAGPTGGPLTLQISNEPEGGAWWTQNVSNVQIVPGTWHRLELYMKKSSVSGAPDGIVRWWVDGTLAANYTNARLRGQPFSEFHLDPVWGGSGGSKSRDEYLRYDHIYISGR